MRCFNPRARAGRDLPGERRQGPRAGFNPRARAGRDRRPTPSPDAPSSCFNPRARAGRDTSGVWRRCTVLRVSIHAPARGATSPVIHVGRLAPNVSIHAPARGATYGQAQRSGLCCVSIHAPARGATRLDIEQRFACPGFNPRARAGRDPLSPAPRWHGALFQSTRPRGARPMESARQSLGRVVSIHAPARGATRRDLSG